MQCSSHAGHSGSSATYILLVEPYVFQLKKAKEQNTNNVQHLHNKLILIKEEEVKDEINSECEGLHHNDQMQDEDSPSKISAWLHNVNLRYRKKLEGGL